MSRRGGARNIKRRKEAGVIEESGPGYAGLPNDVCGYFRREAREAEQLSTTASPLNKSIGYAFSFKRTPANLHAFILPVSHPRLSDWVCWPARFTGTGTDS